MTKLVLIAGPAAFLVLSPVASARGPTLPESVHQELDRLHPIVARAIARDRTLLHEIGAHSPSELAFASLAHEHAVRYYQLDAKTLAHAHKLGDVLAPTDQYCLPYCVAGSCKAMLCLRYDDATNATSLLSIGRVAEAARLADGVQRLRAIEPSALMTQAVVTIGSSEFLYATDRVTGDDFLVPTTVPAGAGAGDGTSTTVTKIHLTDVKALLAANPVPHDAPERREVAVLGMGRAPVATDDEAAETMDTEGATDDAALAESDEEDDSPALTSSHEQDLTSIQTKLRWQQVLLVAVGFMLIAMRVRKRAKV